MQRSQSQWITAKEIEHWHFQDRCLWSLGLRMAWRSTQISAGMEKKTELCYKWPPLSHTVRKFSVPGPMVADSCLAAVSCVYSHVITSHQRWQGLKTKFNDQTGWWEGRLIQPGTAWRSAAHRQKQPHGKQAMTNSSLPKKLVLWEGVGVELVHDACGKECEKLQFCLEEAEELKGNREVEVDVEEPDVLSCPLGKVAVLQVGDVAIAAACGMGWWSRSEHSIFPGASGLWAGQASSQHSELQALLGKRCTSSVPQLWMLHIKAIITLSLPMVFGASHVLGQSIVT